MELTYNMYMMSVKTYSKLLPKNIPIGDVDVRAEFDIFHRNILRLLLLGARLLRVLSVLGSGGAKLFRFL